MRSLPAAVAPARTTLAEFLLGEGRRGRCTGDVADVVARLAAAGAELAELIGSGDRSLAAPRHDKGGGDAQFALDLAADQLFLDALAGGPVHSVASEERQTELVLDPSGALAVALDPLDGSANVAVNGPLGSIFAVFPGGSRAFHQPGHTLLAAGIVVFGPATTMLLTTGAGTHAFVLDRARRWMLDAADLAVPAGAREFAVNLSNRRHWHPAVRTYVDELLAGADGPRGADFNMRWIAAVAQDVYRILMRGGIYLYPADDRPGYRSGRLRLLYEAFPIAFLVEQAGGAATDGRRRLLDLTAGELHQRTPLVFGAADKVARLAVHHESDPFGGERAALFTQRGLFRS